jgi:acetylserotonin N-methyltransferase
VANDLTRPDPTVVFDLIAAFRRSKTMFAAVSLGVFDALVAGPLTAAQLATKIGAHADSLTRLLNACVGLGLLVYTGDRYANTPSARAYLTSDSPERMTGYINYSNEVAWKLWAHLEDGIREGSHRWKQAYGWDEPIFSNFFRTDTAKREFLMGMNGFGVLTSPTVVNAFDLSRFRTLVDLGGATGHLSIAACQRYSQLQAVVFDLPEVLPLAREIIGKTDVANRITTVSGDFFKDALPPADLYAMGRILHDWSEEKCLTLLRRVHAALPAGGALLIVEKVLKEDKSGPPWANMQDLNMLLCTEGRERNLAEYEALAKKAGFAEVSGCRTNVPADAVLAVK